MDNVEINKTPKKKKMKKVTIVVIVCIVSAVIINVGMIALIFVLLFGGSVLSKPEVHEDISEYELYRKGENALEEFSSKWGMDESIWPESINKDMNVLDYKMVYYNPWDAQYLGYMAVEYDESAYQAEVERLNNYESTEYIGYYGVTGFEDYELLAMFADSYNGFVYALTDKDDTIIYVEAIFCNYFMDLDYTKYIPEDYLPEGFDAAMDNPYEKEMMDRLSR